VARTTEEMYEERVSLQGFLDDSFPEGCHVAVMHRYSNGIEVPDYDFICGRPFVIRVKETGTALLYQVALDKLIPGEETNSLNDSPATHWVYGFHQIDAEVERLEGIAVNEETGRDWVIPLEGSDVINGTRIIVLTQGAGPNVPVTGQRELLTELYAEWFLDGFGSEDVVTDEEVEFG